MNLLPRSFINKTNGSDLSSQQQGYKEPTGNETYNKNNKKECDVLSSMVTHTRNWCSAFNPSKCTHTAVTSEHTHCEHAPGAVGSHCSSARGAIGGLVPCSRAPQSWY